VAFSWGGMTDNAWISLVTTNYQIGNKQGLRAKFFDQDWNPATLKIPIPRFLIPAGALHSIANDSRLHRRQCRRA